MKWSRMYAAVIVGAALALVGCSDTSFTGADKEANNSVDNSGNNGFGAEEPREPFTPEVEEEFDFAAPAVVGTDVFVANETANTVAVIDSRTLGIRTVPVGFGPTRVAGPTTPVNSSRVYVLNSGASTVSIVDPETLEVTASEVMRRANSLKVNRRGEFALAWFDPSIDGPAGDLSSVTVVTGAGESFEVAVGFRVESIAFTETGNTALVLTDDGVSVVRLTLVSEDAVAVPVPVVTPELARFDSTDREVLVSPDGAYAVARVGANPVLVLTDLANGEQQEIRLEAAPTDLDWVAGDPLRLLVTLPSIDRALVASVPDGLRALAAVTPVAPALDAGTPDVGASDAGMDAGMADAGVDANAPDAGGVDPGMVWSPAAGVSFIAMKQPRLGAAEVAPEGGVALMFSTLNDRKGAVLLRLDDFEQQSVAFEKGLRGAVSDPAGETFVVLHTREEGGVPPNTTPIDPVYIARSWGISIVDVASAVTRLVLTEQKPGEVTLWNDDQVERLYAIFESPESGAAATPSHRDVLRIDLDSFATDTFRVPSLPDAIGTVPDARRVYINQVHPQGRLTFVDVDNDRRETVTGYQLNAGID